MRSTLLVSLFLIQLHPSWAQDQNPPRLLQRPTVSSSHVAFVYAGDIWTVERAGGEARRLTAGSGLESYPVYSPDGKWVAFAGDYEGNLDVYVVTATGGVPQRITHHPDPDVPVSWSPDGKQVIFRSTRASYARFIRLFSVSAHGGQPTELPLPQAEEGSLSPDGKHIAYVPLSNKPQFPGSFRPVRNYRGGSASPLWIADLADSAITLVPRTNSNDFNPMWIGNTVYFLTDRDGMTTLYSYSPASKEVKRLLDPGDADIKSASACSDAIVYDRFGTLHLFDLKSQKSQPISVRIQADLPGVRTRVEKAAKSIQKASLSPTGSRAVFEARGEILTVPAEKGDIRNLTNSSAFAERDPKWSPDGKSIAYFSDESGEYLLHIRSQDGKGDTRQIKIGDTPSFFYNIAWSPDGKSIAVSDKRMNLWHVELGTGKSTKVDSCIYDEEPMNPSWSPDSKWITYSRSLKNYLTAVFLYSLESGKIIQVTDGMSDARFPAFDANGKYLYFTASTDIGPAVGSGMAAINRPVTRTVYVTVLSKDEPSPLAPESDDEKEKKEGNDTDKKEELKTALVKVDEADLDQRTLALPIPPRNYQGLLAGKAGVIYVLEGPTVPGLEDTNEPPPVTIHRFELVKRKTEKIADGTSFVSISSNGEKLLYRQGEAWNLVGAAGAPNPGEGTLKMDAFEVRVDPMAEWKQIYQEVYRIERDFLYDPQFHGFDLRSNWKKHEAYLPGLGSRHELNYLLDELLAGLCLQHVYLFGGDTPKVESRKGGLLGADYTIEQGRHRISKVYRGESWNPTLRAPLTQPGAAVKEGEFLLAVNGVKLRGEDEIYKLFEGTAGKQTIIKVGSSADGKDAREVTVVPVGNERALRNLDWVDGNRRAVDKLTDGKVAYVYLPNTANQGYARFNRYFFAQAGRDGVIVDERFNGGGLLADHVIDYLRQPIRNYASTREGKDQAFPTSAIPGPKVMLINEQAGSGGDYLPYTFKQSGLGQLIGKRTWGGLVGIDGYPQLIDGGGVTAPRWGIWFPSGKWEVENRGVTPDVEVEFDPKMVRQGKDPQLEKAIEMVMYELQRNPVVHPKRPPFPNYYDPKVKDAAEGK